MIFFGCSFRICILYLNSLQSEIVLGFFRKALKSLLCISLCVCDEREYVPSAGMGASALSLHVDRAFDGILGFHSRHFSCRAFSLAGRWWYIAYHLSIIFMRDP